MESTVVRALQQTANYIYIYKNKKKNHFFFQWRPFKSAALRENDDKVAHEIQNNWTRTR